MFAENVGDALTLSWCNLGYTIAVPPAAAGAQDRGAAASTTDAASNAGGKGKGKSKKKVDKTILSGINGVVRLKESVCSARGGSVRSGVCKAKR